MMNIINIEQMSCTLAYKESMLYGETEMHMQSTHYLNTMLIIFNPIPYFPFAPTFRKQVSN
jgi:hypothetical protein